MRPRTGGSDAAVESADEKPAPNGRGSKNPSATNKRKAAAGTKTKQRAAKARQGEWGFRDVLAALPTAVYTTDAQGRISYYNDAAAELWGERPEFGSADGSGSWKLFYPDDTPMPHAESPMAVALRENRRAPGIEAVAERADGTRIPFLAHPIPLYDADGTLAGAVNMLVDISERKQAEQRQALLVRELHHRVKNTLATVQAIMSSTARASATIEEFQEAFTGRILSLSNTHSLLTEDAAQSVSIELLLHNELNAFDDGSGQRILLKGAHIPLPSSLAVLLGMAIHELTTNAAKFGSLSIIGGSVSVEWDVLEDGDERRLDFRWIERNGPPLEPPTHQGFGTRLLRQVLTMQTNAEVVMDFDRAGLQLRVVLPLR